jgi:hypothetical protein
MDQVLEQVDDLEGDKLVGKGSQLLIKRIGIRQGLAPFCGLLRWPMA